MDYEAFEQLVREGIEMIGDEFTSRMNNVAIIVEDEPSARQRKEHGLDEHTTLLGLYEGIPLTKRENYTLVLPDKITIFKKPIEAAAHNAEEIKELVADTVWHEIGHHFGLDEAEVRRRELRTRQKKQHRTQDPG